MNRTTFRNIMILVSVLLAGSSLFFYYRGKGTKAEIEMLTYSLIALQQELENVARLSASLTELDQMTIDEKTATQLNLLRHLNIEQDSFLFSVLTRQSQTVGETQLYARGIDLQTTLSYPDTLKLMDDLYNTKKLQITAIEMEPEYPVTGRVQMKLSGFVYGLDKNTSATEVITQ